MPEKTLQTIHTPKTNVPRFPMQPQSEGPERKITIKKLGISYATCVRKKKFPKAESVLQNHCGYRSVFLENCIIW